MAGMEIPADWSQVTDIIKEQAKAFFGDMPFYVPQSDEAYDQSLQAFQEQFLFHFYEREIGSETIGLFKLWLHSKFMNIMPYYTELYKTTLLKYNIIDTVDMYREIISEDKLSRTKDEVSNAKSSENDNTINNSENSSTVNDNTSSTGDTVNKFSDTPQNGLNSIEAGTYLTNATIEDRNESTESSTTSSGKSNSTNSVTKSGTDDRTRNENESESKNGNVNEHWHGKEGGTSYTALIKEAREAIININMMIIEECETLFMQVI